jgi:hypothetical protein
VRERGLQREGEEDDARHHRQVQIGVNVAGERGAVRARPAGQQLLGAHREEVEVRKPERGRDAEPQHRGDDHARAERSVSRAEADRDEGLSDGDDHDQAVPLDEVGWFHAPAPRTGEHRPKQADRERRRPERRPERAVDEPGSDDQRGARERQGSDPHDRAEEVRVAAYRERVERQVHDRHDQEGDAEDDTVAAERVGNG